MKRIVFSLGIFTVVAMFVFASISIAEKQAGSEEMVQCAFDGMKGPKSAMKSQMEYQGKTYYFCTDEEKEKFAQKPEKYLNMHEGMQQGEHGGKHEGMEEHGSMMESMGMGSASGHSGMHGGSGHRHGH